MPSNKTAFKGLQEIHSRLNNLAGKIERGAMRDALTKATKPMLKASKQHAREVENTGTLRRSLKRKVITERDGTVIALIGPDRQVTSQDYGGTHIPANIAHLVEFGFQHSGGEKIEGAHFLEAAFEETKEQAVKIYHEQIGESIEKTAKRLEKRGIL